MYRKVEDFLEDWAVSSKGTLDVFKAITNDKLNQAIVEGHNTLGWLAWHLVTVTQNLAVWQASRFLDLGWTKKCLQTLQKS